MKSSFKRTIFWNKYQWKVTIHGQNRYLDYLIDPSFQGAKRLFVLSFENSTDRTSYKRYYFLGVEIKDYNVMVNEQNLFDQPIKKM